VTIANKLVTIHLFGDANKMDRGKCVSFCAPKQHPNSEQQTLNMKSQHTPGPWNHDEYGHICAGPKIIGIAYQHELDDSDYDPLPCLPNARLMAAAPEMLELLQALTGFDSIRKAHAMRATLKLLKELQ